LSTSRKEAEAEKFLDTYGLLFEIRLPASTFELEMAPFAYYPSEEETLCPRGIVLVISDYDQNRDVLIAEVKTDG